MNCESCGKKIPRERLECVPETTTCVGCSKVPVYRGFMEYGHKTAGFLVMLPNDDDESVRRAERAFRRAR